MSNASETINDATQEWQVLIKEVFEGWEPHFESMFLEGSVDKHNQFEKLNKETRFSEEIENGALITDMQQFVFDCCFKVIDSAMQQFVFNGCFTVCVASLFIVSVSSHLKFH